MLSKTAAAFQILSHEKKPMSCEEIIAIAIKSNLIQTKGKTPADTLRVDIMNENRRRKNRKEKPRFILLSGSIVKLADS